MTQKSNAGVPVAARRRRRLRPRVWLASGLGLLAVTTVTGWQTTRGVEEFGAPVPAEDTTTAVGTRDIPGAEREPDAAGAKLGPDAAGGTAVRVTPGGLTTLTTVAPQRLRIPAVELDADVRPVGVDPKTGELAVPEAVSSVGWYRYGPGLDAGSGSVVIAGHVDSSTQGMGAFSRLAEIHPGDRVEVRAADGSVRDFRVVSREVFGKSEVPYDRLFARDGRARLTLVTCGGAFDRTTGSYRDNIVVTAEPVG